jgi:hypothetical protein
MPFLIRVSEYILIGHVCNTVRSALGIYVLEERI